MPLPNLNVLAVRRLCMKLHANCADHLDVVDLALAARAQVDHFVDIDKMVGYRVAGDLARGPGLRNDGREIAPLGVAQQMLHVPRQPVLNPAVG